MLFIAGTIWLVWKIFSWPTDWRDNGQWLIRLCEWQRWTDKRLECMASGNDDWINNWKQRLRLCAVQCKRKWLQKTLANLDGIVDERSYDEKDKERNYKISFEVEGAAIKGTTSNTFWAASHETRRVKWWCCLDWLCWPLVVVSWISCDWSFDNCD